MVAESGAVAENVSPSFGAFVHRAIRLNGAQICSTRPVARHPLDAKRFHWISIIGFQMDTSQWVTPVCVFSFVFVHLKGASQRDHYLQLELGFKINTRASVCRRPPEQCRIRVFFFFKLQNNGICRNEFCACGRTASVCADRLAN